MSAIWAEGKYVDLWTVNHIFSGFVIAGWMTIFAASFWLTMSIASLLFWGWEVFERIFDIEEIPNQAMDIVADYAGFFAFFPAMTLIQPHLLLVTVMVSIVFLILEISGYLSYWKRPDPSRPQP